MFRFALGIAIGWMMFDEQGKKFADSTGNKLKTVSKDTILKAKDALENVDQLKDIMSNFTQSAEAVDVIDTIDVANAASAAVVSDELLVESQTEEQLTGYQTTI